MTPSQNNILLLEMQRIKEKYHAKGVTLTLSDAADYETGLLIRLQQEKSPSLQEAVTRYLKDKAGLSSRSRAEYGTYLRKFIRLAANTAKEKLSAISGEKWQQLLQQTYPTSTGRNKARRLLHGLCEYARRNGWLTHNPIREIATETGSQRTPRILRPEQLQALFRELLKPNHINLAAAIGFMLWEGIRVCELKKMRWELIEVTKLNPALQKWLKYLPSQYHGPIIPSNWIVQWRKLRKDAGLGDWQNDTLRNTYAYYHLKYYNDPARLTQNFKRLSISGVQKKFTSLGNIRRNEAEQYWNGSWYAESLTHGTNE